MDLVDQDQIDASVRGDRADSVGDVGDVGASREFQAEEAGELDGQHAWCRRRWDGDVDDRQPIAVVGEAAADGQFVSPAQLSQRSGLTGARHAADHHAAAGGDLATVELDQQPPGRDHLLNGRSVHQRQIRVVVPQPILMPGTVFRRHRHQRRRRQRLRGLRGVPNERCPSFLGGQRAVGRNLDGVHGRDRGVGRLAAACRFPGAGPW